MKYSIVIPCFNEEGTIKLILDRTKNLFIDNNIELILVNNGSTDQSKEILSELITDYPHAKYINLEKRRLKVKILLLKEIETIDLLRINLSLLE